MQIKFNINEIIETEIYYGFYALYILGGHHIETNSNFYVQIQNIETGEEVELTEKRFKARDYKFGQKAIRFYTFDINEYGKFKIFVYNYEDIVVKDSILEIFPFPFSIFQILLSVITRRSRKPKDVNSIEILIE